MHMFHLEVLDDVHVSILHTPIDMVTVMQTKCQ